LSIFNPDIGEHLVDVLPYFAGPNDPVKNEGEPTYLVDLYVHRFIGPNEDDFICLFRTYNKNCPICEYREKLRRVDNPSDDVKGQIDSARPKRYSVYAILDRDNESKGIQIWTVAHWFFQNNVMNICKKPRTGGVVAFADPTAEEGRSIAFQIKGSKTQQQWTGFQFSEREDDIPDSIIDNVPTLDELLDIPTYEQVKKAFWAGLEVEDMAAETVPGTPRSFKKSSPTCPHGGVFGESFEAYEECLSGCELYNPCHELWQSEYAEEEAEREEVQPDEEYEEEEAPRPTPRRRR